MREEIEEKEEEEQNAPLSGRRRGGHWREEEGMRASVVSEQLKLFGNSREGLRFVMSVGVRMIWRSGRETRRENEGFDPVSDADSANKLNLGIRSQTVSPLLRGRLLVEPKTRIDWIALHVHEDMYMYINIYSVYMPTDYRDYTNCQVLFVCLNLWMK